MLSFFYTWLSAWQLGESLILKASHIFLWFENLQYWSEWKKIKVYEHIPNPHTKCIIKIGEFLWSEAHIRAGVLTYYISKRPSPSKLSLSDFTYYAILHFHEIFMFVTSYETGMNCKTFLQFPFCWNSQPGKEARNL